MEKKFPSIETQDFRLAGRKIGGGWKLVRRGAATALFSSMRKLKQYIRNRKWEDFLLVRPDGQTEEIES